MSVNSDTIEVYTSSTTLTAFSHVALVDATAGAVVITLPPLADLAGGVRIAIKKIDDSANTASVTGDGTETIDGESSIAIAVRYECVVIAADVNSAGWSLIAGIGSVAD